MMVRVMECLMVRVMECLVCLSVEEVKSHCNGNVQLFLAAIILG
jgi:hypothetical protein